MQIHAEGITWPLQTFLDAHHFLPGEKVRDELDEIGCPEKYRLKAVLPSGEVVEIQGNDLRLREAIAAKPASSEQRLCMCECGERLATAHWESEQINGVWVEERVVTCPCYEEALY